MKKSYKPLAMTALRNRIHKINPNLVVELRNVRVNGNLFGCSGFITDPETGHVVYVNTDHNHGTMYDRALYRTAKDTKDFTGGRNHTSDYDGLAQAAVDLLRRSGEPMFVAEKTLIATKV